MFGAGIITTFVVGAMVAASCVLLLACLVLKLDEWGIYPLRTFAGLAKRSWFERLLLLFMVGGLVQYAATKGTNGNDRAAQNDSRVISDSGSETGLREGETESTQQLASITNLCFTSISVSSNFVTLEVAWPTNFFADGTILDYFAKPYALTNAWQWFGSQNVLSGETNQVVMMDSLDIGGTTNQPSALFFKVQDRQSCATTMADADGDGLPDVYELYNGTNPYISDYAAAPKLTVGTNGMYASIESALAESEPYALISLSSEEWSLNDPLRMPDHPVMIAGPADGTAILRSSAPIGAMLLDQGQDEQTLFRNLYLVLEKQGSFQSGFWVGGNLPWSGVGASPTFENIRIRAMYPNTLYYGWHFYRDNGGRSTITNCVMNAANATAAIGVYSCDGPSVSVADSSFINFPTNGDGFATCFRHGTNIVTETAVANTNLTWAGYPLDAFYLTTEDADGDGLSDYDEIYIYDTDPLMADSDGDGVADDIEIEALTDPRDVTLFKTLLRVVVTNTLVYAGVTNYVYAGLVPQSGDELFVCSEAGCTTGLAFEVSSAIIDVCVYRDLNKNGRYDAAYDIYLAKTGSGAYSMISASFSFGDVDGDGVADLNERTQMTDPYSANSYFISKNVQIKDSDSGAGITNYYFISVSTNMATAFLTGRFCGSVANVSVQASATNGCLYLSVYRDLNRNGVYDDGIDGKVTTTINNRPSDPLAIGDSDGDGVKDTTELNDNTDPIDGKNYRLEAVVFYESLDGDASITNYVQLSPNVSVWEDRPAAWFAGHCSTNMSVRGIVTNAYFYANVFRDVNRNGRYDFGVDIFKSNRFYSWNNHGKNGVLIGDSDSDGVCDGEELSFGTNPTNRFSYGFNLDLTMGGVFSTSNSLTGIVQFGDQTIVESFIATSRVFTCRLTNLVTQTGESVNVMFWEDLNCNGVCDGTEMSTSQRIIVDGTNTVVYCRLPLGPFDSDNDGMLDYWEINQGLSPADASDALEDEDDDGLINLHEYMANCDPHAPDGTNTALYALCHSVDDRLIDPAKQSQLTYSGSVRNRSCWAYGVDTTSASPWNSTDQGHRAGTAISGRHVVFANHYQIGVGATIRFVGIDDVVYDRTLVGSRTLIGTDLCIGVLSEDLPESVSPAMILPSNYCKFIADATRVPMLMYDFTEHAIVTDSNSLYYHCENANGLVPVDATRQQHFEVVVSGDSGDPKYFIVGTNAVLVCTLYSYGTGSSGVGPFVTAYKERMQNVMDFLCPGYELVELDFSVFREVDNE